MQDFLHVVPSCNGKVHDKGAQYFYPALGWQLRSHRGWRGRLRRWTTRVYSEVATPRMGPASGSFLPMCSVSVRSGNVFRFSWINEVKLCSPQCCKHPCLEQGNELVCFDGEWHVLLTQSEHQRLIAVRGFTVKLAPAFTTEVKPQSPIIKASRNL